MVKQKIETDLELTLRGTGQVGGGLDSDDLRALADLLKGLKAYDPSLKSIHMFGNIRRGSSVARFAAPVENGIFEVNPARLALNAFFGNAFDLSIGWTWNNSARSALNRITGRKRTLGVKVMPAHQGDAPLRKNFTRKDYETFSKKIAEEPGRKTLQGKILEIDIRDRTFELHTEEGAITCGFPESSTDDGILSLVKNSVVSAEVICRNRPASGQWRAEQCKSLAMAPSRDSIVSEFQYPPGIKPPRKPMAKGLNLKEFAPSLDAKAGEELAAFLSEFKG